MELTVACRGCKARFSARLPSCPTCGLVRTSARTQQEVEQFQRQGGYPRPSWARPLPAGSVLGLGILIIAGTLLHLSQDSRVLRVPAVCCGAAGLATLILGLRRARRRAEDRSQDTETDRRA